MMCLFFALATCLLAVLFKGKIDEKSLIISIQIVTDIIVFFSSTIKIFAEINQYMTSSQRLVEYTELESEDNLVKDSDGPLITQEWPQKGEIIFENVSMRYREGMEPSMRELSCKI
jgi:ATP-binding cassette subfamily C (CFTR/MRP) protein 1